MILVSYEDRNFPTYDNMLKMLLPECPCLNFKVNSSPLWCHPRIVVTASQLLHQQINRCGGDSNDFMMTCNIQKVAITTILVLMVGKIKNMAVAMILVKIQDQELGACNDSTYGDMQHWEHGDYNNWIFWWWWSPLLTWKAIRSCQAQRKVSAGRGASSLLPAINRDDIWWALICDNIHLSCLVVVQVICIMVATMHLSSNFGKKFGAMIHTIQREGTQ